MTFVAHGLVRPEFVWRAWPFDPMVILGLVTAALVYVIGSMRLRRAGRWSLRRAAAFWAGTVALGIALLSPLDAVAETLFSAHMAQHLLLTVVAAPLLVVHGASLRFMANRRPRSSGDCLRPARAPATARRVRRRHRGDVELACADLV
jgi:cytochrome c oxidase assembly factor CtaG